MIPASAFKGLAWSLPIILEENNASSPRKSFLKCGRLNFLNLSKATGWRVSEPINQVLRKNNMPWPKMRLTFVL